jgi:ABC-type glycerol-3-phosphate transport system substrate-binding protein
MRLRDQRPPRFIPPFIASLWLCIVIALGGCAGVLPDRRSQPVAQDTTPPAPASSNDINDIVEPTPTPSAESAEAENTISTLTLWLPPEMVIGEQDDSPTYASLLVEAFADKHPDVQIEVIAKAHDGPAGIVQSLLATQPVAPWRMPDVIVIDTVHIAQLVNQQIIAPPPNNHFISGIWDSFYPFAINAVSVEEARMAVPFYADIQFMVYNGAMIESHPRNWDELTRVERQYALPLAHGDGSMADALLLQYIARWGRYEGDVLDLDSQALASVLQQYRRLSEAGVIPRATDSLTSLEECWRAYFAGDAMLAHVSSVDYQRARPTLQRTHYAPLPTHNGHPVTLARSWAWAIVTDDPERQELATSLIATALQDESYTAWLAESHHLPVQPRALTRVTADDEPYRDFLDEQMANAYPYPNSEVYPQVQEILIRAIEDVLAGEATPEQAASAAASAIRMLR